VPHLSSSGSRQAEWNSWISSAQAKTTFVTFFVFLQFLFIDFLKVFLPRFPKMISVFKLALELWDASLSLQKQWDKIICKVLVVIKSCVLESMCCKML
jgi:hypothetical protein